MGELSRALGARRTSGSAEGCGKRALPVNLRVRQEVTVLCSLKLGDSHLVGLAEVKVDQVIQGCIN